MYVENYGAGFSFQHHQIFMSATALKQVEIILTISTDRLASVQLNILAKYWCRRPWNCNYLCTTFATTKITVIFIMSGWGCGWVYWIFRVLLASKKASHYSYFHYWRPCISSSIYKSNHSAISGIVGCSCASIGEYDPSPSPISLESGSWDDDVKTRKKIVWFFYLAPMISLTLLIYYPNFSSWDFIALILSWHELAGLYKLQLLIHFIPGWSESCVWISIVHQYVFSCCVTTSVEVTPTGPTFWSLALHIISFTWFWELRFTKSKAPSEMSLQLRFQQFGRFSILGMSKWNGLACLPLAFFL